jgi:dTDP-4-dehydrorhamnose reductase
MKVMVTGLNGTLAPHVARCLEAHGHDVTPWDRTRLDPNAASPSDIRRHLDQLAPDAIFHLAMGSEGWAAAMAAFMAERGGPFIVTSTAMVFDAASGGPHHVHDHRGATDGYGLYKIRCEDAVLAASPSAIVARVGWQIDADTLTGNNMAAQLQAQAASGPIRASASWIPATSLMPDTAAGLVELCTLAAAGKAAGIHHLDSNAQSKLTFPQIVTGLARRLGQPWAVAVTDDYTHDQRLMPAQRADTVSLPALPFLLA